MKCTQCGKEWKQMEDIHLPCCPRCAKLHQALKALIEAKGETILGTSQFRGYIADLAPRTETHYKSILRQALAANLDKKLWEIVKENGTGLEIDSLKHNFKTMNAYTDASDYVVDSFLYAFGRISEDKIGVLQQAKKSSKTIKQEHHQANYKYEKYKDKNKGRLVHTLKGHSEGVNSVSYSPDGKYIVSGSGDSTIKVWDSRTGVLLYTLQGYIRSYSPDGKYIVSGAGSMFGRSKDNTIKVWDLRMGALLHTLQGHSSYVWSVSYSPDSQYIVSGAGSMFGRSKDNTIKVWDSRTGALLHTLQGHSESVRSVSYSPDSQYIVSGEGSMFGSKDNMIKVWDSRTGALLHTLQGHSEPVSSVSYSPDGQYIISWAWAVNFLSHFWSKSKENDNTIKVWDSRTGALLHTLQGHSESVRSVSYSPDGQYIVSGSSDNTIKVWDSRTGALLHTLQGHTGSVESVCYSPDGKYIVSGSSDNTIKVWDSRTGALLHTLKGHSESVASVSYSPDGNYIVSGSRDHTIKVWWMGSDKEAYEKGFFSISDKEAYERGLLSDKEAYKKGLLSDKEAYKKGFLLDKEAYKKGFLSDKEAYKKGFLSDKEAYKKGLLSDKEAYEKGVFSMRELIKKETTKKVISFEKDEERKLSHWTTNEKNRFQRWAQKDEYETQAQYNERMLQKEAKILAYKAAFSQKKDDLTKEIEKFSKKTFQEIYNRYLAEYIGNLSWSSYQKKDKYDAETERFLLIIGNSLSIYLTVPLSEAKSFGENIAGNLKFKKSGFSLTDEGWQLEKVHVYHEHLKKSYLYEREPTG